MEYNLFYNPIWNTNIIYYAEDLSRFRNFANLKPAGHINSSNIDFKKLYHADGDRFETGIPLDVTRVNNPNDMEELVSKAISFLEPLKSRLDLTSISNNLGRYLFVPCNLFKDGRNILVLPEHETTSLENIGSLTVPLDVLKAKRRGICMSHAECNLEDTRPQVLSLALSKFD